MSGIMVRLFASSERLQPTYTLAWCEAWSHTDHEPLGEILLIGSWPDLITAKEHVKTSLACLDRTRGYGELVITGPTGRLVYGPLGVLPEPAVEPESVKGGAA